MKRFFNVLLILTLALGGLFLAMRQIALENIKHNSAQSMKLAADGFDRKLVEWRTDLQYLARYPDAISIVTARNKKRQRRNLEALYRQFLQLRKDYVSAIRVVDRFGREVVIVDASGPSRDYLNVSRKPFFQRGMAQRAFGSIATRSSRNNKPTLEYSIPLVNSGNTVGVISLTIDIAALTNYFSSFSDSIRFNHIYVVGDNSKVIYEQAIKVRPEERDWESVKQVYLAFVNSAANLTVLDSLGAIWSFLENENLSFSFLMEMESDLVMQEILDLYIPVAILFSVAILLVSATRSKRKRFVRKGSMVVMENGRPSKGRRSKKDDDPVIRMKDLANISNEIRSPLNNVLGMLSLLRVSTLNPKQKEYLDVATRYSEWILELTNEITDFSALKKGKLKLDTVEFNIRQTIKDVTETLSNEAYKKGLEVFCLVNAEVPDKIVGDPTRLRQILVNLIGNGIKFTENGDVSVNVTTEKHSKSKVVLRIEVSDTGVGIDSELQHTVFTEFEKAVAIPTGENTGVGLGLSITKQLVEMMGGKIGFNENGLGGSTFWLTLPFRVVDEEVRTQSLGKLNGLMAYMVGENAGNRKTIATTMGKWGINCDISGNFENAISILTRSVQSNRPYDIFIVDISVSSSTQRAFELISQVRQTPEISQIKVVLLTARGVAGDSLTAKELEIGAYLTKPINRTDLKNALLELNVDAHQEPNLITRHSLRETTNEVPTVLVVEKNKTYQKLMVGMLNRLGVNADVAETEKDVFDAVKSKHYNMLLVDHHLPQVDIIDFISSLRHHEEATLKKRSKSEECVLQTAVVLLSMNLSEKDKLKLDKVGVNAYLQKPVSIDRIAQLLTQWDLIQGEYFSATEMVG